VSSGIHWHVTGVSAFGDRVSFGNPSLAYSGTFLTVSGGTAVKGTTGSSLTSGTVTLTRTEERIDNFWWRVLINLVNSGEESVGVDVGFGAQISAGWDAEKWSAYRTRGLTVASDLNSGYNITYILRDTSEVTPVSGWWTGAYPYTIELTSGYMWSSTVSSPSSLSDPTGMSFNWKNVAVLAGGGPTTLTFLVGHGDPPQIGDLAEPSGSPGRSPVMTKTQSLKMSATPRQTPELSSTPDPTGTPTPEMSATPDPTVAATPKPSSTPGPTATSTPEPIKSMTNEFTFAPHPRARMLLYQSFIFTIALLGMG
jgi:hypothetical protein